jgi:phosphate starvation-inducible membrane PsiE
MVHIIWIVLVPHSIYMLFRSVGSEKMGMAMWTPFDSKPSPIHEITLIIQVMSTVWTNFTLSVFLPADKSYNIQLAFSSVVRQMPVYHSQRRGTVRTYFILLLCVFVLLLRMFRSLYSVYCLCENVHCTTAIGCQPNCIYILIYISYHIISNHCHWTRYWVRKIYIPTWQTTLLNSNLMLSSSFLVCFLSHQASAHSQKKI